MVRQDKTSSRLSAEKQRIVSKINECVSEKLMSFATVLVDILLNISKKRGLKIVL